LREQITVFVRAFSCSREQKRSREQIGWRKQIRSCEQHGSCEQSGSCEQNGSRFSELARTMGWLARADKGVACCSREPLDSREQTVISREQTDISREYQNARTSKNEGFTRATFHASRI
jgi:hypothetical protein